MVQQWPDDCIPDYRSDGEERIEQNGPLHYNELLRVHGVWLPSNYPTAAIPGLCVDRCIVSDVSASAVPALACATSTTRTIP